MADLTNKIFTDETAAREYLEAQRWPDEVSCPHCGGLEKVGKMQGKSTRPGLWWCGDCRKPFSVTVGTVYERSHIPLNKWLLATHLMCSSKKGISAHQLHRMLGITYKSAWFMAHRIREAMKADGNEPMGGEGEIVEADETYIDLVVERFDNNDGWFFGKSKTVPGLLLCAPTRVEIEEQFPAALAMLKAVLADDKRAAMAWKPARREAAVA